MMGDDHLDSFAIDLDFLGLLPNNADTSSLSQDDEPIQTDNGIINGKMVCEENVEHQQSSMVVSAPTNISTCKPFALKNEFV